MESSHDRDKVFTFWKGIYDDLEISIIPFLPIQDLILIISVSKQFKTMIENTLYNSNYNQQYDTVIILPSFKYALQQFSVNSLIVFTNVPFSN